MILLLGCVAKPPVPLRPTAPPVVERAPLEVSGVWSGLVMGRIPVEVDLATNTVSVGPQLHQAERRIEGHVLELVVARVGLKLRGPITGGEWRVTMSQGSRSVAAVLTRR